MNNSRMTFYGAMAAVALLVLSQSLFIVDQTHQAVIVRVGEVVRTVNAAADDSPGLKVKLPFLESRILFLKINQPLDLPTREIITGNKERLMVDAFVRYRIEDPVRFYTSLGDQKTADDRLALTVNATLRRVLGSANSEDIISLRREALTGLMRTDLAARARASKLGIRVIDVRIRRADLPEANQEAVFDRMKTDFKQKAAGTRAEGEQKRLEIIATATQEAETIRGQADAERAKIFASSFGKDPGFAAFYRSMQAYEASMANGETTLVLSPDSAFFKYFSNGGGG